MARIMETAFDVLYLIFVVALGVRMMTAARGRARIRLFGAMAVVLGLGDSFHLVPRVYAMWTTGIEANAALLGAGQFITSITMTAFYVILYHIYAMIYRPKGQGRLTIWVYLLSGLRVALCLLPQNAWTQPNPPLIFGILRNLPFAALGILIIWLFYRVREEKSASAYRWMWLAVTLSFAFYAPVVLFAGVYPPIGMLMIPKTCAYVWIVLMGYRDMKAGG